MPGTEQPTHGQAIALEELAGLVGKGHVGGRTLCCLVGPQGVGKSWLARHIAKDADFGEATRLCVNSMLLKMLTDHDLYREIFDFDAETLQKELKRFGSGLHDAVRDCVAQNLLSDGLTILDHLELVFVLGMDPATTWYNDAVGSRRILLVLTGRMSGQLCRCGRYTLTRGDQPIVELEA